MREFDITSLACEEWQVGVILMLTARLVTRPSHTMTVFVRFKLIPGLTDSEIEEHVLSEEDK